MQDHRSRATLPVKHTGHVFLLQQQREASTLGGVSFKRHQRQWASAVIAVVITSMGAADLDIMEKPPRSPTEGLVSPWTFVRWMIVGFYVGFATVAAFAFWYMFDNVLGIDLSQDGHSTVTWYQLTHYNQCSDWVGFQVGPPLQAAKQCRCP